MVWGLNGLKGINSRNIYKNNKGNHVNVTILDIIAHKSVKTNPHMTITSNRILSHSHVIIIYFIGIFV